MTETSRDASFLREALALAEASIDAGGGPFGSVVVRAGTVVGRGANRVVLGSDPTAHAEVRAIREACAALDTHVLEDAVLYASCEPCPMCLGAILWSRLPRVVWAASKEDAARAGFDDARFHHAMEVNGAALGTVLDSRSLLAEEGRAVFERWLAKSDRVDY